MSSHTSLTRVGSPQHARVGRRAGGVVVDRFVETGDWSKSGANEIVRFMTRGPDRLFSVSIPLPKFRRNGSRVTAT